jgi:hypothetical protein
MDSEDESSRPRVADLDLLAGVDMLFDDAFRQWNLHGFGRLWTTLTPKPILPHGIEGVCES